MTNEEIQLLLKDLCGRLPYGVKFALSNNNNIYTMKGIDLIVTNEGNWEYAVTVKGISPIEIKYIKPYLRPMSSMTEEEKKEFDKILKSCNNKVFACPDKERRYNFFDAEQEDFMNAHHFDYRGLIPIKLALEASEDMYKN